MALESYDWPGNTRELRIICERLAIRVQESEVTPKNLHLAGLGEYGTREDGVVRLPAGGIALEDLEREAILQALEKSDWVQKQAAALLHISVDRMNARVKKFKITHPSWKVYS